MLIETKELVLGGLVVLGVIGKDALYWLGRVIIKRGNVTKAEFALAIDALKERIEENTQRTEEIGREARHDRDLLRCDVLATLPERPNGVIQKTRHRILLVEDDESDRFALQKKISQYFDIVEATCLSDAMTLLGQDGPAFDCVLLDLKLPNSTGIQTLITLKTMYGGVIYMIWSGNNDPEVYREARNVGADGFLAKAINISGSDIARMIREVIGRGKKKHHP